MSIDQLPTASHHANALSEAGLVLHLTGHDA